MNGLDFALIALPAIPTFMGFRSGLIKMVANLVGIIVGITLAGLFGGAVAEILNGFMDNETVTGILGFIIIVGITLFIATLIGNVIRKALTFVFLGWLDKVAGTALGLLVGALFASVIVFIVDFVPFETANDLIAGSTLAKVFLDVIFPFANALPGNLEDLVASVL